MVDFLIKKNTDKLIYIFQIFGSVKFKSLYTLILSNYTLEKLDLLNKNLIINIKKLG